MMQVSLSLEEMTGHMTRRQQGNFQLLVQASLRLWYLDVHALQHYLKKEHLPLYSRILHHNHLL
jgi:hypothetical protein